MERVLKGDAVEEKGERARMVRLPTPLSVIRSVFVPSYVFPPVSGASPLLIGGSMREAPNRMPGW